MQKSYSSRDGYYSIEYVIRYLIEGSCYPTEDRYYPIEEDRYYPIEEDRYYPIEDGCYCLKVSIVLLMISVRLQKVADIILLYRRQLLSYSRYFCYLL